VQGGAEFAGPENGGPKKIKDWKMQDLENDGPNRRAAKCRTWKMMDPGRAKFFPVALCAVVRGTICCRYRWTVSHQGLT